MKNNILFVTGTDTGVGKTTVSALIAASLVDAGKKVAVLKPVETGCMLAGHRLVPSDGELLRKAAGGKQEIDDVVLYTFESPVAPCVAAREEDCEIEIAPIRAAISELAENNDILIVEGAGGLLVPIAEDYNFSDLAIDCQMKVLLVIGSKLGVLNHSALTFEVLSKRKVDAIGYVFNDLFANDEDDASVLSNRQEVEKIAAHYNVKELGYLPFIDDCVESLLSKGDFLKSFYREYSSQIFSKVCSS